MNIVSKYCSMDILYRDYTMDFTFFPSDSSCNLILRSIPTLQFDGILPHLEILIISLAYEANLMKSPALFVFYLQLQSVESVFLVLV
jgi:hypothetical protein